MSLGGGVVMWGTKGSREAAAMSLATAARPAATTEDTGRGWRRETPLERPAFYALRPGGWRDALTLLHPPYTAWHLSYVAIGAAVAPHFYGYRLVWTLAAFLLGVGVAAHALDELHGRPLGTRMSDRTLMVVAALSLAGAAAIGVVGALASISTWLFAFVGAGVALAVAYDLELLGGRMHSDLWFAFAGGRFPR